MIPTTRRIGSKSLLVGALALLVLSGCGDSSPDSAQPDSAGETGAGVAHRHTAPEETCFICDETMREPGRLWCAEHTRYEDRCWLCQPQLEEKGRLYCAEHWLYEDECFLCHPELDSADEEEDEDDRNSQLDSPSGPSPGLYCNEHRVPELECGICQPQRTAELEPGGELKVRFESSNSASKAGIETVLARRATAQAGIAAFCEVTYDQNALARITPLAGGIVREVLFDVGADVEAGDALVEIHSAEVAGAKAEFVAAVVDYELKEVACQREQRLAERSISSERELQEADAACKTAELALETTRQRLLNYGFTEEEVAAIEQDRDTSAVLRVYAPFDGTLIERAAVVGEAVRPGQPLFSLANLSSMWLELSIPSEQAGLIRSGLSVEVSFRGLGDEPTRGEVTWIDTAIDQRSRMLRARAVVDNADRALSAGLFGDATVFVAEARDAVDVPRESIQRFEDDSYVFVRLEDDLFSLRRIATIDRPSADMVAVIDGLRADEAVVSTGSFTVMSEFLKSRLGAGCVDD